MHLFWTVPFMLFAHLAMGLSLNSPGTTGPLEPVCLDTTFERGDPGPTDVYFLADTTGSMGSSIGNVRSNAASIKASLEAAVSDIRFGVGEYKDVGDVFVFRNNLAVGVHTPTVLQNAINQWAASGGGDIPEGQVFALHEIATSPGISWRPSSTKLVLWFGDAPGHDPRNGVGLSQSISELKALGIKVVALDVGALNSAGQASLIATSTGGLFRSSINPATLSAEIVSNLVSVLARRISLQAVSDGCGDPRLTLSFQETGFITVDTGNPICVHPVLEAGEVQCATLDLTCRWHWEDLHGMIIGSHNSLPVTVKPSPDVQPPAFDPPPVDHVIVECGDGIEFPDPTARDNCDGPVAVTHMTEESPLDSCPNDRNVTRTWTATDSAGNSASVAQVVHVLDTSSPVVDPSVARNFCLFPPNHKYYSFDDLGVFNRVTDRCGTVNVEVSSCASNQAINGLGDGNTREDCQIVDGKLKVRAERSGNSKVPRVYSVWLKYSDACGNSVLSENTVTVPHDDSGNAKCLTTK